VLATAGFTRYYYTPNSAPNVRVFVLNPDNSAPYADGFAPYTITPTVEGIPSTSSATAPTSEAICSIFG
jgi:hypothetical protein